MIPGRLYGMLFAIMAIGFIADTYFVMRGMRKKRMGFFDVIISLSLVFSISWMLTDEQLTMGERIIDSIIAFFCVVSAIVHIYVLKKRMPPDKDKS